MVRAKNRTPRVPSRPSKPSKPHLTLLPRKLGGIRKLAPTDSKRSPKPHVIMDFPSLPISNSTKQKQKDIPSGPSRFRKLQPYTVLEAFTCLPRLPAELRLKVWDFAAFLPRDLDIWVKSFAEVSAPGITNIKTFNFFSSHPTPPILHASHEARMVGLKHYQLRFDVEFMQKPLRIASPPQIYLNLWSDRVCFLGEQVGKSEDEICKCIVLYEIRHLAINVKGFDSTIYDHVSVLQNGPGARYDRQWLNRNIETITFYHQKKISAIGHGVTFIKLNEDMIRDSWSSKVIQKSIPRYHTRNADHLLSKAKRQLQFIRDESLQMLESGPASKVNEHFREMWAGAGDLAITLACIVLD
ncbi:hypothetical protein VTL71DRAFT_14668 [Oculimacula yallundae]|uniref:2EXR domain-containing protein n=1 Tax=Oculimacula yallundae TaxID=86028 RepID=A0ABR4CJA0_9HELO